MEAKIRVLNTEEYSQIIDFISNHSGLAIECELELIAKFPRIYDQTLKSIVFTEWNQRIKSNYGIYSSRVPKWIRRFENESKNSSNPKILLQIAKENSIPPSILSRLVIYEKYKDLPKSKQMEILKSPQRIPDEVLSANIRMCILNDNQEGPIVDLRRRFLGEEYEVKLKQKATEAGLFYFDEADLRRTGFDKTPDLKLVLPCLYKGAVVNWIESKALFGDIRTHKRYLNQQLTSYENRFGPGIVIYWFGFLDCVQQLKENSDGLIILSDFPAREDFEIF